MPATCVPWKESSASNGRAEPGHASSPDPDDAMHRLIRAADTILAQLPAEHEAGAVAEMIGRLGGERAREEIRSYRATRPLLRDTISLTMLQGGYKINVIPEQAEALLDVRLLPDTDGGAFLAEVRKTLGDDCAVEVLVTSPPAAPSPASGRVWAALSRVLGESGPVVPTFVPGFTDSRFFRPLSDSVYRFGPMRVAPDDLKRTHGTNERLEAAAEMPGQGGTGAGVEREAVAVRRVPDGVEAGVQERRAGGDADVHRQRPEVPGV